MKRIKTDALKTRDHILDAAEKVFHRRGVSRPTLEEIAAEAGVTRGAIYWHFRNKCEVFKAMCERVEMPGETVFSGACNAGEAPLKMLQALVEEVIIHTLAASHERTVFEILTYKCELVEENKTVIERRLRAQREGVECIRELLDGAVEIGDLAAGTDTAFAAMMMYGFIQGALNTSMLADEVPRSETTLQGEAARIAALALELPARCLRLPHTQQADSTAHSGPQDNAVPARPISTAPRKTHQEISNEN